jgi:hypothetical protein
MVNTAAVRITADIRFDIMFLLLSKDGESHLNGIVQSAAEIQRGSVDILRDVLHCDSEATIRQSFSPRNTRGFAAEPVSFRAAPHAR